MVTAISPLTQAPWPASIIEAAKEWLDQNQLDTESLARHPIYLGLSGGVDSTVALAILMAAGATVRPIFMKNWNTASPELGRYRLEPGSYRLECPWYDDYLSALRVATDFGLALELVDWRQQFKAEVIDPLIEQASLGLSPNPDIACNQSLKFGDFYLRRLPAHAWVATGHYSGLRPATWRQGQTLTEATDPIKDQSYFLYRVASQNWSRALFPLSQLTKSQVRQLADELGVVNAKRSDSMGICFVGKVAYRQFISLWLPEAEGPIVDLEGRVLGQHQGMHLYTIGEHLAIDGRRFAAAYPEQRGALPSYYVKAKRPATRELIVTPGADHPALMSDRVTLSPARPELYAELEAAKQSGATFYLRIRHLGQQYPISHFELSQWQSPVDWRLSSWNGPALTVNLSERARAVAPGQHGVIYASWPTTPLQPKAVIGGGMILPDVIMER